MPGASALLALLAWGCFVSMFLLLIVEHALKVLHPLGVLFILLMSATLATPFVASFVGMRRWNRDRRWCDLVWTLAAFAPLCLCGVWGGYAYVCNNRRDVPRNLPTKLMVLAAASVLEAREVYLSRYRIETPRPVMFYDASVTQPQADAEAMDRHVARMEELTGLKLRNKIFYTRGPIYDDRHVSFLGLAFGSSQSPTGYLDLHELAHATIGQHETAGSDPPTLLTEGWAESQSNKPEILAARAIEQRNIVSQWARSLVSASAEEQADVRARLMDPDHFLHLVELAAAHDGTVPSWIGELTGPHWYHHDAGAVYPIGGAFSSYLIRRYGAGKFVHLYFAVRPGNINQQCKREFEVDLQSIEADFWREQEKLVSPRPR